MSPSIMGISHPLTCLTNAYLVLPDGTLTSSLSSIWIDSTTGKITRLQIDEWDSESPVYGATPTQRGRTFFGGGPGGGEEGENVEFVDCGGGIVAPGLIDVQINGAFGVDFSEWKGDEEKYRSGVERVARGLLQTGVTSFVPTIISQTPQTYQTLLPLLDPTSTRSLTHQHHSSGTPISNVLGYHLEGPFLSPKKPGCHPQQNLRDAPEGWKSFEMVYGKEAVSLPSVSVSTSPTSPNAEEEEEESLQCVKIITLAPELRGVGSSVKQLASRGWTVSLGHSAATTSQAFEAVTNGATLITHLYNAMPGLHHREPGIIGLLGMPPKVPPPSSLPAFNISQTVHSAVSTPLRSGIPLPRGDGAGGVDRSRSGSSTSSRRASTRGSPTDGHVRSELQAHAKAVGDALGRKAASGTYGVELLQPSQFGAMDDERDEMVPRPYWSIITDGIHCHPQAVNFAYKAHPDGCVLVTDAVQLMDPTLPDGVYPWRDGTSILKRGSNITLEGTDTLAGSAVTLDECVRNLSIFASIPLSKAILCASANAARSLGENVAKRKGRLDVGFDADLSVWNRESGRVVGTWVAGKKAWGGEIKV